MLGIIESWLFNQVGLNCKLDDLNGANIFQNGCVFANILKQYGLIDGNITLYITKTSDKDKSYNSLKILKPVMEMLRINFNDDVINEILQNKMSTIIKVLYELYLCLENKQTLCFTKDNIKNIQEEQCLDNDVSLDLSITGCYKKGDSYTMEKPLVRNLDIVEWYKQKYQVIKNNLIAKEKIIRENSKCETTPINSPPKKCICGSMETTSKRESLPEMDSFSKCNDENLLDYKQYVGQFKLKQKKGLEKKSIEKTIQYDLLQLSWGKIIERQQEMYNSVFSEIMLKQSQYEKQILTRLIQRETQINTQNESQNEIMKKIHIQEERNINRDEELKEEFEALQIRYENEHRKVVELHRKLYAEKQELAKKAHYDLCTEVTDSLIDIAVNASRYQQKYGEHVPKVVWDSWKVMFCKSQSVHIPFETLGDDLQQEDVNYDELIENERELDSVICVNDVNEYLYTCGRWFYKDISLELGNINENVLAYLIYRALTLKYPPPPTPLPADLPQFQVAGVLVNINNSECIDKLKILLEKQNIHMFDPDIALKRSIFEFEKETNPVPIPQKSQTDKKKGKSTKTIVGADTDKPSSKKKGTSKEKRKSKQILIDDTKPPLNNFVEKETQTSIQQDADENVPIIRTPLGILGEEVFNILKEGLSIEDDLLVKVMIEYLKTLDVYNGWLLLNYPGNLQQAQKMELAFTGQKLPQKYCVEDDEQGPREHLEVDENDVNRKSRLLTLPSAQTLSPPFKTYFTMFGNVSEIQTGYDSTHDLDDELEESNDNKIKNLHNVYKDQNVFQDFSVNSWDVPAVKALARAVLGVNDKDEKNSVDLFGEDALARLTKGKGKTKAGKVSPRKEKGKKSKKEIHIESNLEGAEVPKVVESYINLDNLETTDQRNQSVKDLPLSLDDDDWKFVSLPLTKELGSMIATIWENVEESYLQTLNEILFEIRVVNLRLIPYVTYIREIMRNIVQKPDVRQNLVNMFIDYYNEVEDKVKVIPDVKSYLHCKVLELQQQLWEIMDEKRLFVESNRQKLVKQNWLLAEITLLINNYLALVQNEYDRSLKTFCLIYDYYFGLLDKVPTVKTNQFERIISKVTQERLLEMEHSNGRNSKLDEDNENLSLKKSDDNFIIRRLLDCNDVQEHNLGLITDFIHQEIDQTLQFMVFVFNHFNSQHKKEEDMFKADIKKLDKGNVEGKIANKPAKDSDDKKPKNVGKEPRTFGKTVVKKTNKIILETGIYTEKIKAEKESLFREWKFAFDTEMNRFEYRIYLIEQRAIEDILEFYFYLEGVFCNMYKANIKGYDVDIINTNTLCKYLNTAIEEEVELLRPITFNQHEFFIELEKEGNKEDSIKELMESVDGYNFTIRQLKRLRNIFAIAGPYGVIRKQPLCYILQDLMLFNADDNQPHLPRMWNFLNEYQLKNVMDSLFGPEYAIDWRDFLIYNLEIPFPSIDDILLLRQHFLSFDVERNEVVSFEVYKDTPLWFENDLPRNPQEGLRFAKIKSLLFDMFRINDYQINYTALLLYFCKDTEPTLGFQKALCLSVGKHVIISEEEVEELIQAEAEVKHSIVNLLKNMIDSIVMNREGVSIYEIDEPFFEDMTTKDYKAEIMSAKSQSELMSKYSEISAHQSESKIFDVVSTTHADPQNRSWVSRIPIITVSSVLNASLIHQDKTFTLRKQYLNCLEDKADEDGMIEAHELVTLECIQNLFTMTNKFKIASPSEILEQCLNVL